MTLMRNSHGTTRNIRKGSFREPHHMTQRTRSRENAERIFIACCFCVVPDQTSRNDAKIRDLDDEATVSHRIGYLCEVPALRFASAGTTIEISCVSAGIAERTMNISAPRRSLRHGPVTQKYFTLRGFRGHSNEERGPRAPFRSSSIGNRSQNLCLMPSAT